MKRTVLPALSLILLSPLITHAQQKQNAAAKVRQVSTTQPASVQPEMTPLKLAELRADIFMARKMYPEAIATYEGIVKKESKNAVVLNKLGVAFEIWGNNRLAERYFKKAIQADKTYASAFNNVGTVEYAKHHYGDAIKWYEKTLKLRGDMPAVYSNLGYAYFDLKKYPEAMNAFQQAIQLDPLIFQQKGDNGSVVQQRGVTDPGLFYFFVARTYAQLGNAERAAHYLKMARDDGYQKFVSAKTDPAFAKVIKDPQVIAVFAPVPELAEKR
ncbi:MAG TPA: tetratricopeptide repeat protein [Candidatus Acidoferrales bacterium]|nr:tetratricopeptide repeat protein [Candidatus Acidoferrales bacterium]